MLFQLFSLLLSPYGLWLVIAILMYIYRRQLNDGWRRLNSHRAYVRFLKEQTINQYNAKARLELGLRQLQLGNSYFAVTLLEEAAKIDPENAEIHYHLGIAYQRSRNIPQATAELERCIELRPDFMYGQAYIKLADIFYQQRAYEKTLDKCKQALEINAYEAEALFKTGLAYYKLHQKDDAKQYLDRTITEVKALPRFRYKKDRIWLIKAWLLKFWGNLL